MSAIPGSHPTGDAGPRFDRRRFLRSAAGLATAMGIGPALFPKVTRALEDLEGGNAPLLWLQGSNCTGCSVSLLNSYPLLPITLLTRHVSLKFHQTLSTAQGQLAVDTVDGTIARGGYILVVEGAVPTAIPEACVFGGEPFKDQLARAAASADLVVAVGACASFGGIPAAPPNPIGAMGVGDYLASIRVSRTVVNVPGCPPHPDWMIGTLVHALQFGLPALDAYRRPTMFFGTKVHDRCPMRRVDAEAKQLGAFGCMEGIGCRGKETHSDCMVRRWNGRTNDCIASRGSCIGCTSPVFARDGAFYREED